MKDNNREGFSISSCGQIQNIVRIWLIELRVTRLRNLNIPVHGMYIVGEVVNQQCCALGLFVVIGMFLCKAFSEQ